MIGRYNQHTSHTEEMDKQIVEIRTEVSERERRREREEATRKEEEKNYFFFFPIEKKMRK